MSLFIVTMSAIALRLWFTQHLLYKIPKRPNLNSGFCLSVTLFLLVAPSELNRQGKMLLPPFYTLKTSAPSTLALPQMPLPPPLPPLNIFIFIYQSKPSSSSFKTIHPTILLLLQNNTPNHPPFFIQQSKPSKHISPKTNPHKDDIFSKTLFLKSKMIHPYFVFNGETQPAPKN